MAVDWNLSSLVQKLLPQSFCICLCVCVQGCACTPRSAPCCSRENHVERAGKRTLQEYPPPEQCCSRAKQRKALGLTLAADLCSFLLSSGGASYAAEGEGGKDRVVLPVSWDPRQGNGAPCSALDVQPCKTGGGECRKMLKEEASNLGRAGRRCWGMRPGRVKR